MSILRLAVREKPYRSWGGGGGGGTDMRRIRRVIIERRGKANDYSFYCVTDMCPRSLSAAGRGAKGVLNVLTRHL